MQTVRPKRRWWQTKRWRLALFCLALGCLALPWIWSTYQTQLAIKEIESLNGLASPRYNFQVGGRRVGFGPIDSIGFLGPRANDSSLKVLKRFSNLRALTLTNTQVSDEGLSQLRGFRDLNSLYIANIDQKKLMGRAAAHMNTKPLITAKGLESLRDLPNLQVIQLIGAQITDEHLNALSRLKSLVLIDLKDTSVTAAVVDELKKTLPNCQVRCR